MSAAIQAIGESERGALVAFLRSIAGDDAEDVAQEALLRAYAARDRFQVGRPVLAWLRAIASNIALDLVRRRRRLRFVPLESEHAERAGPQERPAATGDEATLLALRAALDDLPENERRAFCLFYEQGKRIDAIAKALGAPAGTVKSWLHRARERLRVRLSGLDAREEA